ncbi:MAG: hypothetical protein MRK02_11420 [Candidatus Scalindua sp.]|nr:hypothetical protein [Candidatus Scalindua sp.]
MCPILLLKVIKKDKQIIGQNIKEMQQVDKSKRIREIENKIDTYFHSHRFMKLPRSMAIQYLLIAYEEANRLPFLLGKNIPTNESENLALIQNNKYSLTHSINWASKITKIVPEEIIKDIDGDIYTITGEFFYLALSYHGAVSAYTMWSRGVAEATLVNENTVQFKYSEEETRYDMLDMKVSVENEQKHSEGKNITDDKRMINAKIVIEKSVKQTGPYTITYSRKGIDCDEIIRIAHKKIKGQTIPPADWNFYNVTTENFEKFWSALISICWLHYFALYYAALNMGIKGGAVASTVIVYTKDNWIRQLSIWTGLSKQIILQVLEYHTYSIEHKKPDIVVTPFIFITEKHLALAPTLITTSNLGRNLLKHLANNYSDEYDRNSGVFADNMISEFCKSIKRKHFEIFPNLKIPDNKELPDIDICLLDERNQQVMLCEFKWTIPAAEPYEVFEKREREKKALDQLVLLKKYFRDNPTRISKVLNYNEKIKCDNMFFIGVLKNCVGTAFMFNKDIPIVEYSIFCKLLNESKSLEETVKCIRERKFLPKKNVDFEVKNLEYEIGKFKIIWEGCRQIISEN